MLKQLYYGHIFLTPLLLFSVRLVRLVNICLCLYYLTLALRLIRSTISSSYAVSRHHLVLLEMRSNGSPPTCQLDLNVLWLMVYCLIWFVIWSSSRVMRRTTSVLCLCEQAVPGYQKPFAYCACVRWRHSASFVVQVRQFNGSDGSKKYYGKMYQDRKGLADCW